MDKLKNTSSSANKKIRIEYDTFGPIKVKKDRYWAAQTQRSLQNFPIGTSQDKMPLSIYKALAIIKKCASIVRNIILNANFQSLGEYEIRPSRKHRECNNKIYK